MSLLTLPDEALSEVVRHLRRADRNALRLVHPTLSHFLRASNVSLWRHLYVTRFASRASQPPVRRSNARLLCELHDIADDYLIHRSLPTFKLPVTDGSAPHVSPPLVAPSREKQRLFVAHHHRLTAVHTRSWKAVLDVKLPARAACLHADAHAVAVGLQDGGVFVVSDGGSRYTKTHYRPTSCVLLHPQLLISASHDSTIRLRKRHTRRSIATLRGHGTCIRAMHLISEGELVTSGGDDQRVKLWDLERHTCVSTGRLNDVITHSAQHNGLVYAMADHMLHVLDPRQGVGSTAALLTLPRGSCWRRSAVGALSLATDGSLGAAVGSGGVAVWDARGTWEATGFGWPTRWEGRHNRLLRALHVGRDALITGGGAKELLTFSRSGSYEGIVAEESVRRAAISSVNCVQGRLVVGGDDGTVAVGDGARAEVLWDAVYRALEEENERNGSLWQRPLWRRGLQGLPA